MGPRHVHLRAGPNRYRVVVLTLVPLGFFFGAAKGEWLSAAKQKAMKYHFPGGVS